MTEEAIAWEFECAQRLMGGFDRNAGTLVVTKNGLVGRTFSNEGLVNGKVRVYCGDKKLLCRPENLKVTGYIN
ncbi:hypothetical protein ACOKFD_15735 [Flagellimonas sp. S174]|uniref:hypothetical protein n=1 Tax=Flagellimonas sp. S174 TaxID=3410790 RepID=UPI003BF5ED23